MFKGFVIKGCKGDTGGVREFKVQREIQAVKVLQAVGSGAILVLEYRGHRKHGFTRSKGDTVVQRRYGQCWC